MNWLERQVKAQAALVKAQAALAGLEQTAVAELMGMTPQAFYQRLKRADGGRIDAGFLTRLAETLKCDISVFTTAMEEEERKSATGGSEPSLNE